MEENRTTRREFLINVSGCATALGMLPLMEPVFAVTLRPTGTGYLYDKKMLDHIISPGHVECPERIIKIHEKMTATGLSKEVVSLDFFGDPYPYVKKIHTATHVSKIQSIPKTNIAAETSAAGALGAAKAVCEGTVRNAFCNTRP